MFDKKKLNRLGTWPNQRVAGRWSFWQELNVSCRSGLSSSLRWILLYKMFKCQRQLHTFTYISAHPPTGHLGCSLGTCLACWPGREGLPGFYRILLNLSYFTNWYQGGQARWINGSYKVTFQTDFKMIFDISTLLFDLLLIFSSPCHFLNIFAQSTAQHVTRDQSEKSDGKCFSFGLNTLACSNTWGGVSNKKKAFFGGNSVVFSEHC